MPAATKSYLAECCADDPDGFGPEPLTPAPGSESLWSWLADLSVLREQLAICRASR